MEYTRELLTGSILASYSVVSPAVILIHDYILTFEREYSLVWLSPWSMVKALFILTRYAPFVSITIMLYGVFVSNPAANTCRLIMVLSQLISIVGIIASEAILFMRTWAIWNCDTRLGAFLATVIVGAIMSSVAIFIRWQSTFTLSTELNMSHTVGCFVVRESRVQAAWFGVIISLETLVLALTVVRMAYQYCLMETERVRHDLFSVLHNDGIIFFICMFLMSAINITVVLTIQGIYQNILVVAQQVLHSILSARVLFNLRETQRRGQTMQSISDVVFAPRSRLVASASAADNRSREIQHV